MEKSNQHRCCVGQWSHTVGPIPVHELNVQKWKLQDRLPELVPVAQFMYPYSRPGPGLPAVICPGLAEPPPLSV